MNMLKALFVRGIRGSDAILQDGTPQIAFIGRSNVGKSSVLNALTGVKGLARVGKKPGKTTEINIFSVNTTHYFVDLPGYGYAAATPGEREKLRKLIIWYFTSGEAHPARTILILEAKAGCTPFDRDMLTILQEKNHPYLVVLNKIDKLSQKERVAQMAAIRLAVGSVPIIQTSTQEGIGIDVLREAIFTHRV